MSVQVAGSGGAGGAGGADGFGNNPDTELLWAQKAGKAADCHWQLLLAIKSKRKMNLTKMDGAIYADFRRTFPTLPIVAIDLKRMTTEPPAAATAAAATATATGASAGGDKAIWRAFCNRYENVLSDFNSGTLLRIDSRGDYHPDNTTVVARIQFLAIEIARNREGVNDAS